MQSNTKQHPRVDSATNGTIILNSAEELRAQSKVQWWFVAHRGAIPDTDKIYPFCTVEHELLVLLKLILVVQVLGAKDVHHQIFVVVFTVDEYLACVVSEQSVSGVGKGLPF